MLDVTGSLGSEDQQRAVGRFERTCQHQASLVLGGIDQGHVSLAVGLAPIRNGVIGAVVIEEREVGHDCRIARSSRTLG